MFFKESLAGSIFLGLNSIILILSGSTIEASEQYLESIDLVFEYE
jgi:hypothetical protein